MRFSKIFTILGLFTFAIAFGFNFYNRSKKEIYPTVLDISLLEKYFTGRIVTKWTPEKYFEIYENGKPAGYCFYTSDIGIKKSGYGGPINLFIVLDLSSRVIGVEVVNHNETPPYVTDEKLTEFLKKFIENPEKIETITGATITSDAILSIVEESLLKFGKIHRHFVSENDFKKKFSVVFLICLIGFILFGFLKKNDFLRFIGLFISVFFIGFYTKTTFSLVNIANIFTGRFMSFSSGFFSYIFFGLILVSLILFGRFYCGWLCPFGAVEEFVNIKKIDQPDRYRFVRKTKYFILWFALILVFIFDNPNLANCEPFNTFFTFSGSNFFVLFTIVVILASVFFSRFYCRYLCPLGALFGIFSKLSIWKIRMNKNCNSCGKCVKICPVGAIEFQNEPEMSVKILQEECIQCNKCIISCNTGGITRTR